MSFSNNETNGGNMINFTVFRNWLHKHLSISLRNQCICTWYLIFLMSSVRKHTLEEAAKFSGKNKSQFSKFLKNNSDVAVRNLGSLSKKQAKQFAKIRKTLAEGKLPWKTAIIIDSTIQNRSSVHPSNAKKFNHGKGFVIGHQWTNIVLVINDGVIPLTPIPFYSKNYCKKNKLTYQTENDRIVEYIEKLDLKEYIGRHNPHEIVVLADGGYDVKKIEKAIVKKKWKFIIALNKTRNVKSEREYSTTNKTEGWTQVADFFKRHRWAKWQTIRLKTKSGKRKRMEFRIRQIIGYLGKVGKVQLICSEFKKRSDGRRKYLACNDLRVKARLIIIGYRLRWLIEIFHKQVKMFLGFEDVATKHFESVMSHVYWVYCVYILLNFSPPGIPDQIKSLAEKQRIVGDIVASKETNRVIQLLTQFKGYQRYKKQLQRSLMVV